jgi:hypothetical protein
MVGVMATNPMFAISARRAAKQIIAACRSGRAELVITTQASFAIMAQARPRTCSGDVCHSRAVATAYRLRRGEGGLKSRHLIKVVCPDRFARWRRFIQFDPIVHELSYDSGKFSEVRGFSHITISAKTVAIDEILLVYR